MWLLRTQTEPEMKTAKKTPTTGQLVNKLENCIAVANMRGDKVAAERFRGMLEMALNGTQMPKVIG